MTLRQATYAEATGNFATAVASAQRVVDYAQQAGDQELVVLGYLRWGRASGGKVIIAPPKRHCYKPCGWPAHCNRVPWKPRA